MNKILVMLMLMIGFTMVAQDKKNKNAKYDIAVNGNCGMCKKRIAMAAYSVKGVKSAQWSSEDGVLHLMLNEEKCTVIDVEKAIAKVGHDTQNVKATAEDYAKLHGCCQYDRK